MSVTPASKPYKGLELTEYIKDNKYEVKDYSKDYNFKENIFKEDIPPYFPSKELIDAVEYARILKRPLLLRGEPGCGKTRLAQALAYELYTDQFRDHYFEWHIKSTTKAIEGLYVFDHLNRLRDVELNRYKDDAIKKEDQEYLSFGPLGNSFLTSRENNPSVLLIDEIDKADIDFPNDLLLELDQKRFFIDEIKKEIIAEESPIIIITSNDEKELPNAFLRRCVYHYIDFPDDKQLLKIVEAKIENQLKYDFKHLKECKALSPSIVQQIIEQFQQLYNMMEASPAADKKPSTSELLDWVRIIHLKYIQGELSLDGDKLPVDKLLYPEVLLKSIDDQKYIREKWNNR